MKFDVKKECYHKGRRLMPGDTLEVESKDVRWIAAQGKISPSAKAASGTAAADQDGEPNQNNRRGRRAGANKKGEKHE